MSILFHHYHFITRKATARKIDKKKYIVKVIRVYFSSTYREYEVYIFYGKCET